MALSIQLKNKIDNSIDYMLQMRKQLGVDYLYKAIPNSMVPQLTELEHKNYWKTINQYKSQGYEDDIIDVMILLGLPKIDWSQFDRIRDGNFIGWVLAHGLVQMLDIKKQNKTNN